MKYANLNSFVEDAQAFAQERYEEVGGFHRAKISLDRFTPVSSLGDAMDPITTAFVHPSEVERVLSERGFQTFYDLPNGQDASVFLAVRKNDPYYYVARIGCNPDRFPYTVKNGHDRSLAPHTFQALDRIAADNAEIQLMSFFAMWNLPAAHEGLSAYGNLLRNDLYPGTCFKVDQPGRDLAVLRDGTIGHVDPGSLPYTEAFYGLSDADQQEEIARSQGLILERSQRLGVPPQLCAMNPDGTFKQDQFFAPLQQKSGPTGPASVPGPQSG